MQVAKHLIARQCCAQCDFSLIWQVLGRTGLVLAQSTVTALLYAQQLEACRCYIAAVLQACVIRGHSLTRQAQCSTVTCPALAQTGA